MKVLIFLKSTILITCITQSVICPTVLDDLNGDLWGLVSSYIDDRDFASARLSHKRIAQWMEFPEFKFLTEIIENCGRVISRDFFHQRLSKNPVESSTKIDGITGACLSSIGKACDIGRYWAGRNNLLLDLDSESIPSTESLGGCHPEIAWTPKVQVKLDLIAEAMLNNPVTKLSLKTAHIQTGRNHLLMSSLRDKRNKIRKLKIQLDDQEYVLLRASTINPLIDVIPHSKLTDLSLLYVGKIYHHTALRFAAVIPDSKLKYLNLEGNMITHDVARIFYGFLKNGPLKELILTNYPIGDSGALRLVQSYTILPHIINLAGTLHTKDGLSSVVIPETEGV